MREGRIWKRVCGLCLCATLSISSFGGTGMTAYGASKRTFLVAQAKSMALAGSSDYKKKYNEILLKQIKYRDAVRSVKEKRRNLTTFRWTPLLSFHFPEKLNLAEEMEFVFKPAQIQMEIINLKHELADMKYGILEKVEKSYSDCYVDQERIRFTEEAISSGEEELKKNRYRLSLGQAAQSDIDKMEKSIKTQSSKLSLLKRTFETDKSKLSDLVGMDVTSGYTFKNPFQTADIPRDKLEEITRYTLSMDQSYFEAKAQATLARDNLETAERLMRSQYGGQMNGISPYVTLAKQGKEVDTAAFQMAYDGMLDLVDKPWQGKKRILFIKIPREWFKGQISGIRYVEDEPYTLFNACLDYITAYKECADIEKGIRSEVAGSFEAIVTAKTAYEDLVENGQEQRVALDKLLALNKQGRAEFEEVSDKRSDYQDTQMDMLGALKDYNDLLYAYDRLTCGAITSYLKGQELSMDASGAGNSLVAVDEEDYPYYYIESRIQDKKFVFGVHIPEDFEPEITDYELWYGDLQIGGRTPVEKQISHLAVAAKNEESRFTVRLFRDGTFVEQCEIDPEVLRDRLNMKTAVKKEKETEKVAGSYQVALNSELGLATITLYLNQGEGLRYYGLFDQNGNPLYSEEPVESGEGFTYLSVLAQDLQKVRLVFYDEGKERAGEGYLNTAKKQVMMEIKE